MSANGGDFTTLATNQGATTSSADQAWRGGEGVSLSHATFGGGTVVLEYLLPSGTWIALATHSAAGPISFRCPAGRIRATTTGAAAAAYAYAAQT